MAEKSDDCYSFPATFPANFLDTTTTEDWKFCIPGFRLRIGVCCRRGAPTTANSVLVTQMCSFYVFKYSESRVLGLREWLILWPGMAYVEMSMRIERGSMRVFTSWKHARIIILLINLEWISQSIKETLFSGDLLIRKVINVSDHPISWVIERWFHDRRPSRLKKMGMGYWWRRVIFHDLKNDERKKWWPKKLWSYARPRIMFDEKNYFSMRRNKRLWKFWEEPTVFSLFPACMVMSTPQLREGSYDWFL